MSESISHKLKGGAPYIKSLDELDELLAKRLQDQKIQTYEDLKNLLKCSDPELDNAVNLLYDSIISKKNIVGIHDSDVDGLSTATLAYRFFKTFIPYGVKIEITDRKQGYGFLPLHVDNNPQADLFYTADNGITSFDACKKAKELNKKVIINDHHQPEEIDGKKELPEANAIVDPFRPNCDFEYKEISGTVVFFIMLWKLLIKFGLENRLDEFYKHSIDILALSTLSDVMPLNVSINRFFVKDFIDNHLNQDYIAEYMKTFKRIHNEKPLATDFSFSLIPALNATQRMATPIYGFHFLIQEAPEESEKWFNYIFELNESRKTKQQELITHVEKYYKDWIKDKNFIVIPGNFKKEYEGILGIMAGRLAEKYKRPAIVLNLKDDTYAGSGRSVGNINILEIFRDLREKDDFFTHLGGHNAALGLGIKKDRFNEFYIKLQEYMNKFDEKDFVSKKRADFYIDINQVNIFDTDLYYELLKWEPFGHKFPKPIFKTYAYVKNKRIIGKNKNHMTIQITDKNNIINIKALWFFFDPTIESKIISGQKIAIIWQPELDTFNGAENLSIRILDIEILEDQ